MLELRQGLAPPSFALQSESRSESQGQRVVRRGSCHPSPEGQADSAQAMPNPPALPVHASGKPQSLVLAIFWRFCVLAKGLFSQHGQLTRLSLNTWGAIRTYYIWYSDSSCRNSWPLVQEVKGQGWNEPRLWKPFIDCPKDDMDPGGNRTCSKAAGLVWQQGEGSGFCQSSLCWHAWILLPLWA